VTVTENKDMVRAIAAAVAPLAAELSAEKEFRVLERELLVENATRIAQLEAELIETLMREQVLTRRNIGLAAELAETKRALAIVQDTSIAHAGKQNLRIEALEAALRDAGKFIRDYSGPKSDKLNAKIAAALETQPSGGSK
jgi:hypothetical protein